MKNKFTKTILVSAFLALPLILPIFAYAQNANTDQYTLLAPLPCIDKLQNCSQTATQTTLESYIPGLFKLAIGLSAVFAVLMIVLGGIQYMSADAVLKKEDGKKRVYNSVLGLVLVIGAWLILNTVNPKLLNFTLEIKPTDIQSGAGGTISAGGTPMTQAQIDESNQIRTDLGKNGVLVANSPCTKGQTTQCVNLNGLNDPAVFGVIDLHKTCGALCTVIITGGTEAGHSATGGHPTGDSLDIRFDSRLDSFIASKDTTPTPTSLGNRYDTTINGKIVIFLKESDHWHVTFK